MTLCFFECLSVRVETVANFVKLSTLDCYKKSVQRFSWSFFFFWFDHARLNEFTGDKYHAQIFGQNYETWFLVCLCAAVSHIVGC
jgi:hypothetical protein